MLDLAAPCQLGRVDYDQSRYCHEHASHWAPWSPHAETQRCDAAAEHRKART